MESGTDAKKSAKIRRSTLDNRYDRAITIMNSNNTLGAVFVFFR